jgi:hypothetical protein
MPDNGLQEALASIGDRLGAIEQGLSGVDGRLSRVETAIGDAIEDIDRRLDRMSGQLAELGQRLTVVERAVVAMVPAFSLARAG